MSTSNITPHHDQDGIQHCALATHASGMHALLEEALHEREHQWQRRYNAVAQAHREMLDETRRLLSIIDELQQQLAVLRRAPGCERTDADA